MAEFYEEKIIKDTNYANRYRNCKLLTDIETGEMLLSTREIPEILETSEDKYHRIESNELNRLDMLAYNYYKNSMLWWFIAQANDIFDPFAELEVGTLIRIPSIEAMYGNNGALL